MRAHAHTRDKRQSERCTSVADEWYYCKPLQRLVALAAYEEVLKFLRVRSKYGAATCSTTDLHSRMCSVL